jgi:hypothetical protein
MICTVWATLQRFRTIKNFIQIAKCRIRDTDHLKIRRTTRFESIHISMHIEAEPHEGVAIVEVQKGYMDCAICYYSPVIRHDICSKLGLYGDRALSRKGHVSTDWQSHETKMKLLT